MNTLLFTSASFSFIAMAASDKKRGTGCPIAFALDIFGDRWSLIILRDLILRGYKTYSEILSDKENIATNILAARLRELERDGIISKEKDPENRRQNIYRLTEKGAGLIPAMLEIIQWSAMHDPNTKARRDILERIHSDREGLIADLSTKALEKI